MITINTIVTHAIIMISASVSLLISVPLIVYIARNVNASPSKAMASNAIPATRWP
jgi:hypothetical protein